MTTRGTDRQSIVVGVDGSPPSKRALAWAANQAELTGLPLIAVTVWHLPTTYGWAPPVSADGDMDAEFTSMLENTVKETVGEDRGIEVGTKVVAGYPAAVFIELSKQAALLVLGSRGHGEFVGMLLGSVSLHVLGHAHCPVVIVGGTEKEDLRAAQLHAAG